MKQSTQVHTTSDSNTNIANKILSIFIKPRSEPCWRNPPLALSSKNMLELVVPRPRACKPALAKPYSGIGTTELAPSYRSSPLMSGGWHTEVNGSNTMGYDLRDQRPMSIAGLKALAKKIARVDSVPLHMAQDEIARRSGARNYAHFRYLFGIKQPRVALTTEIFLEQDWHDPEEGKSGRAVLKLPLSTQVEGLPCRGLGYLPRTRIRRRRANRFLLEAWSGDSECSAREDIVRVARTIQFVDATRLIPVTAAAYGRTPAPRYQGLDHSTSWMDPQTNRVLHVDEPYINPKGTCFSDFDEYGQKWCRENEYDWIRPFWGGMYRPEDWCDFILLAHSELGQPLRPIAEKLEFYYPAILRWTGDFIA